MRKASPLTVTLSHAQLWLSSHLTVAHYLQALLTILSWKRNGKHIVSLPSSKFVLSEVQYIEFDHHNQQWSWKLAINLMTDLLCRSYLQFVMTKHHWMKLRRRQEKLWHWRQALLVVWHGSWLKILTWPLIHILKNPDVSWQSTFLSGVANGSSVWTSTKMEWLAQSPRILQARLSLLQDYALSYAVCSSYSNQSSEYHGAWKSVDTPKVTRWRNVWKKNPRKN